MYQSDALARETTDERVGLSIGRLFSFIHVPLARSIAGSEGMYPKMTDSDQFQGLPGHPLLGTGPGVVPRQAWAQLNALPVFRVSSGGSGAGGAEGLGPCSSVTG